MSNVIDLENLMRHVGVSEDQLKQRVTDRQLDKISQHVVEYKKYGPMLGVSDVDIKVFEQNIKLSSSIRLISAEVFKKWHSLKLHKATYLALVNVALKLRDGSGAEKICETCLDGDSDAEADSENEVDKPAKEQKHKGKESVPVQSSQGRSQTSNTSLNCPCWVWTLFVAVTSISAILFSFIIYTTVNKEVERNPMTYCLDEVNEIDSISHKMNMSEAEWAVARMDNLWDVPELKVHFLNEEALREWGWECRNEPLTTTTILLWATEWNSQETQSYPRISDKPVIAKNANIRIRFTNDDSQSSWSKLGRHARRVKKLSDPTMVLNLGHISYQQMKYIVLHEFGHALGLQHEHQRSDFWDQLDPPSTDEGKRQLIIGLDKMKNGNNGKCLKATSQTFGYNRFHFSEFQKTNYDADSIMHYWFSICWLKEEYRDLSNLEYTDLDKEQKEAVRSVHARDYQTGTLPESPSIQDRNFLKKIYGIKDHVQNTIQRDKNLHGDTDYHKEMSVADWMQTGKGVAENILTLIVNIAQIAEKAKSSGEPKKKN